MVAVITTTPTPALSRKLGLGSCSFKKKGSRDRLKTVGESISLAFDCKHSIVFSGVCPLCHQRIPDDHSIAFDYITEGLRMTLDEIARLKVTNSKKAFGQKKLHLVLDLDHTLLHTKDFKKLTPNELYLKKQTDLDIFNGSLFVFDDQCLVKLRPFVRTFLEEVSSMFEIFVCSMGSRYYVKRVAKLLDPEGKYFDTRLIAREDFRQNAKKDLNLVLGEERGIVIVDDTKSVWSDHLDNLITIDRYSYFTDRDCNCKSYAEMKIDETADDGVLMNVLGALKRIHGSFFDSTMEVKDVRCMDF